MNKKFLFAVFMACLSGGNSQASQCLSDPAHFSSETGVLTIPHLRVDGYGDFSVRLQNNGLEPISFVLAQAQPIESAEFPDPSAFINLEIFGYGYFQLLLPDGRIAYTKNGSFFLSADGQLVSRHGYPLQPSITIPVNMTFNSFDVENDGTVTGLVVNAQQTLGHIQIALFTNENGLDALSPGVYLETDASGAPQPATPGSQAAGHLINHSSEPPLPEHRVAALRINPGNYFVLNADGEQVFVDNGDFYLDQTGYVLSGDRFRLQIFSYDVDSGLYPETQLVDLMVPLGVASANLTVSEEGVISYTLGGERTILGKIALAMFMNPTGLREYYPNVWQESFESGQANLGAPSTGLFGTVVQQEV